VEKAREDKIEVVNAVKMSLDGWTSKKTQEFYQPSQVRLRTVYLDHPTVPYCRRYIDSSTKIGILAITHHWFSPDWESRLESEGFEFKDL
jgi:hypothetical protein